MSENHSTTPSPSGKPAQEAAKPAKPHPDFPLALARQSPPILANYLTQRDALHAGRKAPQLFACFRVIRGDIQLRTQIGEAQAIWPSF